MSVSLFVLSLSLQSPLNFPHPFCWSHSWAGPPLTSHSLALRAGKGQRKPAPAPLPPYRTRSTPRTVERPPGPNNHRQPVPLWPTMPAVSLAQSGRQDLKSGLLLSPWAFPAGDALGQVGLIFSLVSGLERALFRVCILSGSISECRCWMVGRAACPFLISGLTQMEEPVPSCSLYSAFSAHCT